MNNISDQSASDLFDVIIVGGGSAGLSAALVLGRSCRRVLVIDSANLATPCLMRQKLFPIDGIAPSELLHIGQEKLHKYDGVTVQTGEVIDAKQFGDSSVKRRFEVTIADGHRFTASKLLLATGVKDILPAIDGFAELWGTSIFQCPYCHGWEVQDRPLAIYQQNNHCLVLHLYRIPCCVPAPGCHCPNSQIALAWLLHQGDDIVPIPGTKRRAYLEENAAAAETELSREVLDRLNQAAPVGATSGDRYNERMMSAIDR